jgi:antitoxin PrlF
MVPLDGEAQLQYPVFMKRPHPLESTLADRYQTIVPTTDRHALGLRRRDRIRYAVRQDGSVLMRRAEVQSDSDPALRPLFQLLTADIKERSQHLQQVPAGLARRLRKFVALVPVGLDDALDPDDK